VTEVEACQKLFEFRKQEDGFVGISFNTILGTGANGAIIHYHPTDKRPAVIGAEDVVLVDSGGHYRNGTTDVTRTIHMGSPTPHQRRCYTRVLQGHVDMARAVVSASIRPDQLDLVARLPLFADGLDYRHGTGHGVGAYLNVHEYPCLVSSVAKDNVPLQPGYIFSDEPGYYESGNFGIRIESLVLCKKANLQHKFHHPYYLEFENLTVVPFCRKLIDVDLLNNDQVRLLFANFCLVEVVFLKVAYIDTFHQKCYDTLSPRITDKRELEFLRRETWPLRKSRVNSFPLLALCGVGVLLSAVFLLRPRKQN
jgi:Xaa-Pro aminopeptidase